MAKPNYSFEKRQRELEKKRKKEEKAQRKAAGPAPAVQEEPAASGPDLPGTDEGERQTDAPAA